MAPRGDSWVLAVVLGLTLVVVDTPSVHQHRDPGPAWYDEECPSLRLALAWSDPGIRPAVDDVQPIAPVAVVVPAVAAGPLRLALVSTGPRGPPTDS
jgi:hypothetical protein